MKIIWLKPAQRGLESIMDYIAEESHAAARRYGAEIYARVNGLLQFPESGQIYSIQSGKIIRKIIIGKTKTVFYRVGRQKIYILSIQDNRQDWKPENLQNTIIH